MPRKLLLVSLAFAFLCPRPADAAPGTVTGTVTRAATSAPVSGAGLALCDVSYNCVYAVTNASGVFSLTVEPGTYFLYTYSSPLGLINEIYDDLPCTGACQEYQAVTTGTAIVVTSGGTASGRHFALADGASISGTITNAATAAPLAGVGVYIYTKVGINMSFASADSSDAFGAYSVAGLTAGTYYAYTNNGLGMVNQIFDGIPCPGLCEVSSLDSTGTPIVVTAGATAANRNFALTLGGSVTGTVRNSATLAPVQGVAVSFVAMTSSGPVEAGTATTNASGVFTRVGLPSGTYYAYTNNELGFINEYDDNQPCFGSCPFPPPATATPIPVTAPLATPGRDFSLEPGGSITGTIRNSVTSAPVANVTVYAYARSATGSLEYISYGSSNASGAYTIGSLPTATYLLHTYNGSSLVNEVFDNVQCLGYCSGAALQRGTGVPVTLGMAATGKDFALQPGGSVSGTVLSLAGLTPIPNTYVYLYAAGESGDAMYVSYAAPDGAGAYTIGGLASGTYYAFTAAPAHVNAIHSSIRCLGSCNGGTAVSAGTPIAVTAGTSTTGISFSLATGGRITGTVRHAATSAALSNVYVYAYRSIGSGSVRFMGSVLTNSAGAYVIGGATAGDYYVFTSVDGFHNQIHAGLVCPGACSADLAVAHGTAVPVSSTGMASGIDFALNPVSGRIAGRVTNATTGAPAAAVYVYAYARAGADYQFAGYGYTSAGGEYQISLPPGTYYLVTRQHESYLGEIYDNTPCWTTCDYGVGAVAAGAPVTVTSATVTADFALQPMPVLPPGPPDELWGRVAGGTVTLEWYESAYGGGTPSDYVLEVGLSPRTTLASMVVAGNTFQHPGVPPGRYFFRVRGRNSSGVGPSSGEFELTVNADGSGAPGAPQSLVLYVEGNRLYADWSEPWYGGYATDFVLEAGTATGLSNLGRFPVGSRTHFELEPPPPPGVYFVRVRGRNALSLGEPSREFMLVIGGVPAPPDGPGNLGFALDAARRVMVAWTAPRGAVSGYMLDVGSASGRYDLGSIVLPPAPTFVITPGAVPPGMYFVRIRAINASGVGVPSSERILFVP